MMGGDKLQLQLRTNMNGPKESLKGIYQAIQEFLQTTPLSLSEFWQTDRLCVPFEFFLQMMATSGIKINKEVKNSLDRDQVQLISLQQVIEGVQVWKNAEQSVGLYLSKPKASPNIKTKEVQHENVSAKSKDSNWALSRKFLSEHAQKEQEGKIKLNKTLRNVKNESDYLLSLKIGEANDICGRMKNGVTYYLETKKTGRVEIMRSQKGKQQEKISEKKFETQYEDLKISMLNHASELEGSLEQDLKKVLVQVMCLSSDMSKQIKLLQKKAISH